MQAKLGFVVVDYLPYDSYVRKSVRSLFAILSLWTLIYGCIFIFYALLVFLGILFEEN